MNPIDDNKDTVTIRGVSHDEEGMKRVEKTAVVDMIKHVEKKMIDKGLARLERHPRDGLPIGKQPKAGRGGKFTWEGPGGPVEDELEPVPAVLDENDPNYVDEEAEERVLRGEDSAVAKVAEEGGGVGRMEHVDPHHLKVA